jgi:hypothetical protein
LEGVVPGLAAVGPLLESREDNPESSVRSSDVLKESKSVSPDGFTTDPEGLSGLISSTSGSANNDVQSISACSDDVDICDGTPVTGCGREGVTGVLKDSGTGDCPRAERLVEKLLMIV